MNDPLDDEGERDPWNDSSQRHPRARELMAEALFDCADEDAPFGSDEGYDAYYEFRRWRAANRSAPLTECIEWIGSPSQYPDQFTFDATILATVLGQLVDEGRIDAAVKDAGLSAIESLSREADDHRQALLVASARAILRA